MADASPPAGSSGFMPMRRKSGTGGAVVRDKAEVANKMRELLASKKIAKSTGAASGVGAAASSGPRVPREETEEEADPWPQVSLPATAFGVEDGRRRAEELQRRGDFEGASRMWSKVLYIARRCDTLSTSEVLELSLVCVDALLLLEDWSAIARISRRALEAARSCCATPALVKILCAQARARAELGCEEAARSAMAEAVSRDLDCMDSDADNIQEQARHLENRIQQLKSARELEARRAAVAAAQTERHTKAIAASGDAPASLPSATASASAPPRHARQDPSQASVAGLEDQAAALNQEFFLRMEQDYAAVIASDGWEDIRRVQDELKAAPPPRRPEDMIPADSDYYKVSLPAGAADREIRATHLSDEALAAYRLPKKPGRNLDELRRVEAATREAVEKEQAARLALAAADSAAHPPIKCRSDVVRIDSLDDDEARERESEDSDERNAGPGEIRTKPDVVTIDSLDDDEDVEFDLPVDLGGGDQANAAMEALKEIQRIGREKAQRMKEWRQRFGE